MQVEHRSTLDLDFCSKEDLFRVLFKIAQCPSLLDFEKRESFLKGYHVILWCSKSCDVCRLVFDHDSRFAKDCDREPRCRNVLFTVKRCLGVEERRNF